MCEVGGLGERSSSRLQIAGSEPKTIWHMWVDFCVRTSFASLSTKNLALLLKEITSNTSL